MIEHETHDTRTKETFDCLTWNIHRARGRDGRIDARRIENVLIEEVCRPVPHVLALQEADNEAPPHHGFLDIARIETATGLICAHGAETRWGPRSHGFLGSVLFLQRDIAPSWMAVVDLPGVCARGAVVLEAVRDGRPVRFVTSHLSLAQVLRIAQMRTLGQFLARRPPMPTILMGDLNEWRPWGGLALSRAVIGRSFRGRPRATFPSRRAILPLDRILSDTGRVEDVFALASRTIRAASDHLPLSARVLLDP